MGTRADEGRLHSFRVCRYHTDALHHVHNEVEGMLSAKLTHALHIEAMPSMEGDVRHRDCARPFVDVWPETFRVDHFGHGDKDDLDALLP
jgi:hypothetical protein